MYRRHIYSNVCTAAKNIKEYRIKQGCKIRPFMSRRIPSYLDPVAAGTKHHVSCFVTFLRTAWKTAVPARDDLAEKAFGKVVEELKGEVNSVPTTGMKVEDVLERYGGICEGIGVSVPASSVSRK